jgi:drug/metabolite transporter (DMT)-like permease
MLVATQMLSGSAVFAVLALVFQEPSGFAFAQVSARSWWAFVYLIIFGALIGYAAYVWLLTVVPPSRAGTYAYVNPVVAMFLGWAFANEPLSFRSATAAAIILASVVVITTEASPTRGRMARRAEESEST